MGMSREVGTEGQLHISLNPGLLVGGNTTNTAMHRGDQKFNHKKIGWLVGQYLSLCSSIISRSGTVLMIMINNGYRTHGSEVHTHVCQGQKRGFPDKNR